MKTSKINIKREKQYADGMRKYKILLDGEEIDTISRGEEKEFQIFPGKHKIQLEIDWCKSNEIEFEIKSNENLNFLCGSNAKDSGFFSLFRYLTVWRNNYLYIELEK